MQILLGAKCNQLYRGVVWTGGSNLKTRSDYPVVIWNRFHVTEGNLNWGGGNLNSLHRGKRINLGAIAAKSFLVAYRKYFLTAILRVFSSMGKRECKKNFINCQSSTIFQNKFKLVFIWVFRKGRVGGGRWLKSFAIRWLEELALTTSRSNLEICH